jgi:hypothetical protein
MPCDSIQTNTVELGAMSLALLKATAARERWGLACDRVNGAEVARGFISMNGGESVRFDLTLPTGTLSGRDMSERAMQARAAMVKRAYAETVVRYAAAKNGWTVKQTGARSFQVVKGGA